MAGAVLKRFTYGYDTAGNRSGEQIDLKPSSASYNTANQLTIASSVGQVRFKGSLNKPWTVTAGTTTTSIWVFDTCLTSRYRIRNVTSRFSEILAKHHQHEFFS